MSDDVSPNHYIVDPSAGGALESMINRQLAEYHSHYCRDDMSRDLHHTKGNDQ